MSSQLYRTCPESGLQFHKPAELLMKVNAVAAVVFLLIGGISAIGVTLTRWPAIHLLPADQFYQVLTWHGVNMLLFWVITFEMAVLYFCSSTVVCYLPVLAFLVYLHQQQRIFCLGLVSKFQLCFCLAILCASLHHLVLI